MGSNEGAANNKRRTPLYSLIQATKALTARTCNDTQVKIIDGLSEHVLKTSEGPVMSKFKIYRILLLMALIFLTLPVYAWEHAIDFGYGYSHDPNHTKYNNSGYLLTGELYTLKYTPLTHWSITGALGQWHNTAPQNKNLTTAALSLALRLYGFDIADSALSYFLASFGPAYLSNKRFGLNTQAKQLTIQSNLGVGAELNEFDINFRLVHYSNANTAKPNNGFNILYLLSVGFLF